MKKKSILFLAFLLFLALAYFGYKGIQKEKKKKMITSSIQTIPSISFPSIQDTTKQINLEVSHSCILIYFHPECEHCQYEAQQLVENKNQLLGVSILMISDASFELVNQFYVDFKLGTLDNLKVLWDRDKEFDNHFGNSKYPTVFIYNQHGNLMKKYEGETKIEAIIKYIN